jgi:hypothetical protein
MNFPECAEVVWEPLASPFKFAKAVGIMRMNHVLVGAFILAGALALAGVGSRSSTSTSTSSIAPESPALAPMAPVAPIAPEPAEEHSDAPVATQILEGEALETLDVPEYTYIRIGRKGAADEWVAVTSAKVKVGDNVRFESQTVMTNFTSAKLKRTFERIHFGKLAGQDAAQGPADPHGSMVMPGEKTAGAPVNAEVPVGKIDKADGPNGLRIADVFAQKKSLAGKTARVRGVVVKATNGVMGKNFVHLQDGSGNETQHDNDLTFTTSETLEKGQTVVLEGTVTLEKDLGAGYHYDVLIEDAIRPK